MPSLINGLIALSYAVLGVAFGIVSYRIFGVSMEFSAAVAVLTLLAGAQIHTVINRNQERRAFEDELTFLQTGKIALSEELEALRKRTDELSELFNEKSEKRNHQIVSEVRLLETLIRQMAKEMETKAKKAALEVVEHAQTRASNGEDPQAVRKLMASIEDALNEADEEEEHEEEHEEEEFVRIDIEQTRYDAMLHLHEAFSGVEVVRGFLTYVLMARPFPQRKPPFSYIYHDYP